MLVEILIIVLLTLLNGVFSMSEMAVVSSRRARLQGLADAGSRGARVALRLAEDPRRFLATAQIGITLIGVLAGAFGGATVADELAMLIDDVPFLTGHGEVIAMAAVVVAITYLSLVVGELVPKRIALRSPETVATAVARPMKVLARVAKPLVWLLGVSSEALLRLIGLNDKVTQGVTEEEVRLLITEGTQTGVFDPREKSMIEGVLSLADRTVRSAMRSRHEITWLDADAGFETVSAALPLSDYSRFPLCRTTLDELVGIIQAKDILDRLLRGELVDLASLATPALVIHDSIPLLKALDLFKSRRTHLAVVVDEYGMVEGLITMADILEAIAGELPDRGEEREAMAVQRDDGTWLVDGRMPLSHFERTLGVAGPEGVGEFTTIAGFALWSLGHVPRAGEIFYWQRSRFEIVDMDGHRIDKLLVAIAAPPPAVSDDGF